MTRNKSAIWPPYQAFYIQSMLFNSMSAIRSIARLDKIFENLNERRTEQDLQLLPTKIILNEFQNMVLQAGALSRYFWPVPKAKEPHQNRGQLLREAFSLDETSPQHDRNLRNALEHFDERSDKYLAEGIVGVIFPEYVGLKPADDGIPGHFFRAYFVDVGAFRLLDEEFLMQPLAEALIDVHSRLTEMDQTGGMLRSV